MTMSYVYLTPPLDYFSSTRVVKRWVTIILSAICWICWALLWISSFSLVSRRSTISSRFTWFSRVFLPSCTHDNKHRHTNKTLFFFFLVWWMQPQVKSSMVHNYAFLLHGHHSTFCRNANWTSTSRTKKGWHTEAATSIWPVSDTPLQCLYLIISSSSQWF